MTMRSILIPVAVLMTTSVSATAQTAPPSASASAKAFSLDLAAPTPATDPTLAPDRPTSDLALTSVQTGVFTLDTPIAQLVADPRAKAVLDRDLPGLSGDSNLAKFQSLSLRRFQPMTGGQMSDALLAKTGTDLAAIGPAPAMTAPTLAPPMPTVESSGHKKIDSGR